MKSKVEQVIQINPSGVWSGESEVPTTGKDLPGIQPFVSAALVATAFMLTGAAIAYWSGQAKLNALAGQYIGGASGNAIVRLLEQANRSASALGLTVLIGSAGFVALAVVGGRRLSKAWETRHLKAAEEAEVRIQRLLGQLTDSRVTEEEARRAQQEMEARLGNVSNRHAALERELEQRRQAEKTLAQQTHQLERSKDVLEMHVQARTYELQKLQHRNELILNSAAEGICGFDLQGRATFVNPAAARATGWKVDELIGQTEEIIFFPPKSRGKNGAPGWLKDGAGNLLPEQSFFRKDGSNFPAEYVRTSIREGDRVVGAVVTFKDITERRMAEDKLNQKAAELSRSNRELEQFAFVASHDLQEPLRKIQAFGDRLKIKCESMQINEGWDYLDRMQSAAGRMQTLINDLLTFSRVISSLQPLVPVDLAQVTGEVLGDLEHRIEKTGAHIKVGALPTIQADPTQMRQLLQNLIGNALKFQTPGAAPIVTVEAQLINRDQLPEDMAPPNSGATAKPDDQFCVLMVKDNGIGFDEKYLEKVFTVFQRLHGRSEYEGTGVGLAVCRRITDRHGGLITAKSKPGEGATFIVTLPVQQPKIEEPS